MRPPRRVRGGSASRAPGAVDRVGAPTGDLRRPRPKASAQVCLEISKSRNVVARECERLPEPLAYPSRPASGRGKKPRREVPPPSPNPQARSATPPSDRSRASAHGFSPTARRRVSVRVQIHRCRGWPGREYENRGEGRPATLLPSPGGTDPRGGGCEEERERDGRGVRRGMRGHEEGLTAERGSADNAALGDGQSRWRDKREKRCESTLPLAPLREPTPPVPPHLHRPNGGKSLSHRFRRRPPKWLG